MDDRRIVGDSGDAIGDERVELISIVVPCYNEEEALPAFADELARVAETMREVHAGLRFELVIADDGSRDGTLEVAKALARDASRFGLDEVKWVSFSRNFGKEAALMAGLERASGELVAIMDADMQDPPSLLPRMYDELAEAGCDCVAARRVSRKGEPVIRSLLSRLFYRLLARMSSAEVPDGARDFRLMRRVVVDAVLALPERCRFSKGIFGWVGFDTRWISYENEGRVAGESKWGIPRLAAYALDGMASFSTAPLTAVSALGVLMCVASLVAAVVIFVRAALFGDPVAGWPSLACIITLTGGLQLLCLGVLGQYLARAYVEVKGRPHYVVKGEGGSEPDQAR